MFDQAKADKICQLIAEGKSLRQVAKKLKLGSHTVILREAAVNAAFCDQYTRAMDLRIDGEVDEFIEIREMVRSGKITSDQGRVMMDSIKWPASKLKSKKYGDRLDIAAESTQQVIVRHVLHTREPTAIEFEPHDVRLIGNK